MKTAHELYAESLIEHADELSGDVNACGFAALILGDATTGLASTGTNNDWAAMSDDERAEWSAARAAIVMVDDLGFIYPELFTSLDHAATTWAEITEQHNAFYDAADSDDDTIIPCDGCGADINITAGAAVTLYQTRRYCAECMRHRWSAE